MKESTRHSVLAPLWLLLFASLQYHATAQADGNLDCQIFWDRFQMHVVPLVIDTQPQTTLAGQPIQGPPGVLVTDSFGTPVAGVDVTVYERNGVQFDAGTLTVPTDANGLAAFGDLFLNTAGVYGLVFDAEGIEGNTCSDSFDVQPGAPDSIVILVQPGLSIARDLIAGPPTVYVLDAHENRISGVDVTVSEQGSASFDAGTTLVTTGGPESTAVFDDLVFDTSGTYTLVFAVGAVDAVSSPFDVLCLDAFDCPGASGECCDGACVELDTDEQNCGACGLVCSDHILDFSGSSCSAGMCQIECESSLFPLAGSVSAECDGATPVIDCQAGFVDENRDPSDGCETELAQLIAAVQASANPDFDQCDGSTDTCVVLVACDEGQPGQIQQAVDDLGSSGGIVIVSDEGMGACVGDITISSNNVWIVADGLEPQPVIRGVATEAGVNFPALAANVDVQASGVVIRGLGIEGPELACPDSNLCAQSNGTPIPDAICTGSYHSGIVVDGNDVRILDNDFFVTTGAGSVAIQSPAGASSVDGLGIRNNHFTSGDASSCDPADAEWIACAGCPPPIPDNYEAIRVRAQDLAPADFVTIERNRFEGRIARVVNAERQQVRIRHNLLDGTGSNPPGQQDMALPRGVEVHVNPPLDSSLGVTTLNNWFIGFRQGVRVSVLIGNGHQLLAGNNCFFANDAAVTLGVDPHINGTVDATSCHWDPPGGSGSPSHCSTIPPASGTNCIEASTSTQAAKVLTEPVIGQCPPLLLPR